MIDWLWVLPGLALAVYGLLGMAFGTKRRKLAWLMLVMGSAELIVYARIQQEGVPGVDLHSFFGSGVNVVAVFMAILILLWAFAIIYPRRLRR